MKKVLIGCALLFVLVIAAGALWIGSLDKSFHVERSITIDAPAAAIYPSVANLRTWPEWTVWNLEKDPTAEWTYTGEDGTVGAWTEWTGAPSAEGGLGHGKMETTELVPNQKVGFDLTFLEDGGEMTSQGAITLEEADGRTTATWTMDGEIPGFVGGLVAMAMDTFVGPDFEGGLQGLKELAEAGGSTPVDEAVEAVEGAAEGAMSGQDG